MPTGTYQLSDLYEIDSKSAADYGLDIIADIIEAELAAHNRVVIDMVSGLCFVHTNSEMPYGGAGNGEMVDVDDSGRARTQKRRPAQNMGFPLWSPQYALGWTDKWFKLHTPAELAAAIRDAQVADLKRIKRDIKRAFYYATNESFSDFLATNLTLYIKRFVNADSAAIPVGPNGEEFDGSTHTPFSGTASLTNQNLVDLVNDVSEHGHTNNVVIAINVNDVSSVKALADFEPYVDARVIPNTAENFGRASLDRTRYDNRPIGVFNGAEVWTKPWAIQSYIAAYDAGEAPSMRPLGFRQRSSETLQGLMLEGSINAYPHNVQYLEREFGVAVKTRTNGAVLYTGGGSYVQPTIT